MPKTYTRPDDALANAPLFAAMDGQPRTVWAWQDGIYTIHPADEPVCEGARVYERERHDG